MMLSHLRSFINFNGLDSLEVQHHKVSAKV